MSNITMTVDDDLIRKVRKVAAEKNTTLTAMVRRFLESVAGREETRRKIVAARLKRSFRELSRDMGKRTWRREDLYVR